MNALKLEEIIGEFCDNYCQYPCQIKDVGELEKSLRRMSNKSINGVELNMVTYGVLIWSMVGSVLFGCSVGMLINEGLNRIKDKIEMKREDKKDD